MDEFTRSLTITPTTMTEQMPGMSIPIGREPSNDSGVEKYAAYLTSLPAEKLTPPALQIRDSLLTLAGEKSALSSLSKLDMLFYSGRIVPGVVLDIPSDLPNEELGRIRELIRDYRQLLGETEAMAQEQKLAAENIISALASLSSE